MNEHLDTILTALHERRNRLVNINTTHNGVSSMRERIIAVNKAIRAVRSVQQKEEARG